MGLQRLLLLGLLIWAADREPASAQAEAFTNSLGMKMVLIRPSQYLTGTRLTRDNASWYERDEIPRWSNVGDPFHMAAHEVTNAQYRQFTRATGRHPPRGLLLRGMKLIRDFDPWEDPKFSGDDQPVVCVTYADAEAFCAWLSRKEGRKYRLPSSDEWEYACRAGTGTDYNWGSGGISPDLANYEPLLRESDSGGKGCPMFSLEQAARLRGGQASYDAKTRQATATILGKRVTATVGRPEAKLDDKPITMPAPASLVDGKVLVPVRFLAYEVGLLFAGGPKTVGSYKPNEWGLFDMHGNVNEITSTGDTFRTVRGGGWNDSARRCRSASVRNRWKSDSGMAGIGFRVVCDAPPVPRLNVSVGEAIVIKPSIPQSLIYTGRKILRLHDGTLVIQDRVSRDGGRTWRECPLQPNQVAIELRDGTILSIPFQVNRDSSKPDGWGRALCLRSTDGWKSVEPFHASFHVPGAIGGFDDGGNYRDAVGWCDHDVVEMPDGTLLMTMYGFLGLARVISDYQRYPIETQQWKYVAWVVSSSDRGKTWAYQSTCVYYPEMTRGGGCELGLARLAGGDLLCGARTGEHGYPNERMLFVRSKDGGKTWGDPSRLSVDTRPILGIYPQFVLMESGILAMTWGRTGYASTAIAFSLDGQGHGWSDLTPIPDDLGGYNDLVEVRPGMLLATASKRSGNEFDLRVIPISVTRMPAPRTSTRPKP
ncbi:MAG: SUMF1/EgtB/PvdO family nonheme iron enzyme [Phycisphaerae bacterium]|nr:SUMF1/EgtB/PvdO family nonheme iron enzyme [Phycisphaerae bacterium]